jgi:hypothetical protein
MVLYRSGTIKVVAGGAAQKLNLGFIPDWFYMRNDTIYTSGTVTGVTDVWFDAYMSGLATPYNLIITQTTGVPAYSRLAEGTLASPTGILPFQSADSDLYTPQQAPYTTITGNRAYIGESTNLVITGLSNAGNASVTATHSFTTSDIGVTVVTFHGVLGMTQINGLSGIITGVASTTSFTVNINSSNFGVYVAGTAGLTGGFANVITGAPVDTLYGNALLPTAEANLGIIGLLLGTSVMVNTNDIWSYQAFLQSPVTGP